MAKETTTVTEAAPKPSNPVIDALPAGFKFPRLPWTVANLGEDLYCEVATALRYFNPKCEMPNYRPALDPTPYLDYIKRDNT